MKEKRKSERTIVNEYNILLFIHIQLTKFGIIQGRSMGISREVQQNIRGIYKFVNFP